MIPDIHLCILAGGDNRFPYLRDTVHVSRRHFAAIHILDTGSTDETESLKLDPDVNYRRLAAWRDNWSEAYSEVTRDVPCRDWFLFLDSDERPSPRLLQYLKLDVALLEGYGCNLGRIPSLLHYDSQPVDGDASSLSALVRNWPTNHDEYSRRNCWTKQILVKRLPDTSTSAFGGHCSYRQAEERSRYLPHHYNHYKSKHQVTVSTVLCSWACIEAHDVPVNSPEWIRHNELRQSTGLETAQDFLLAVREKRVPPEWLDYWSTMEHSHLPAMVAYWRLAFVHEFDLRFQAGICGRICCQYEELTL